MRNKKKILSKAKKTQVQGFATNAVINSLQSCADKTGVVEDAKRWVDENHL